MTEDEYDRLINIDPLAPARGMANGCAISTVLWAAIISIVIGFVKLMGG